MLNEKQFTDSVYSYSDLLFRFALSRGLEDEEAKDIVQDTYLSAWKNRMTYRGEVSLKNWLFLILKNKITDHFRKTAQRKKESLLNIGGNDDPYFDEEDHWKHGLYPEQWKSPAEEAVQQKEFYNVLQNCSRKMKQIQYRVFLLKYVDGMNSTDICKQLQLTASNYWVLVHRAKVQLRACIQKNWVE